MGATLVAWNQLHFESCTCASQALDNSRTSSSDAIMLEDRMLNSIDNTRTLWTLCNWGLSREIGFTGVASCCADSRPSRQKLELHRCVPFQLCYRRDLARIHWMNEGSQEFHLLLQNCCGTVVVDWHIWVPRHCRQWPEVYDLCHIFCTLHKSKNPQTENHQL